MDLPIKFPSETEVILEDVAQVPGADAGGADPIHPRPPDHRCPDPADLAEGGLGQAVYRGARNPVATGHPGVHRTPCT